jgi:iron complex outermembrane receptor protein
MKFYHKIHVLVVICIAIFSISLKAQNSLTGRVTDVMNNSPIAGASIYIPDLKIGAVTKADGTYLLNNLPSGTYVVQASFLGYGLQTQSVTIKSAVAQYFSLAESEFEGQEVVITGTALGTDPLATPVPIVEVPNSYLVQNASTNIIDALSKIPGVSGITDGQSIAKPVIRGLGYNRVVTVNDGVRQEGQQWGDEFGIEADPNSVDRVEILKGPGSLAYGSDAISGVINLIPEKTLPEGQIKGDVLGNYQTNNGLYNGMLHVAGTEKGISWSARFTNIAAHAYQNKYDGYVFNSQFSNLAYDATLGIHRSWGFSQVHYSYFEMRTGIVEGTRDSATGRFVKQKLNYKGEPSDTVTTDADLISYHPFLISQLVQHIKLVWDNSIAIGAARITARFAYQSNDRAESNDITIPLISNIHYHLNTLNYDVRYISADKNNFSYSIGANGMNQNSQNIGPLLLIPEYNLFDIGVFGIVNKKMGNLNLSGGLRYDIRTFDGHDAYVDAGGNHASAGDSGARHAFTVYTQKVSGISGSIGATYQFKNNIYIKANAARGYRAPNVAESGSNGIHDGTVVWEIGDHNLAPETSLQFDIAPGIMSKNITAEVDIFANSISNYIYPQLLKSKSGGDSITHDVGIGDAPTFKYVQGNASLAGLEAMVDIHPEAIPWLDFYIAYSTLNAYLTDKPDSAKYLPFTPPAKLRAELTFNLKKKGSLLSNTYLRLGMNHVFSQDHVYEQTHVYYALPAAEAYASISPSDPYTLFNLGLGTDFMNKGKKMFSLYISVDNLTDAAYLDYMSRFKYYPVNFAANPFRVGVYNMGRNVSFKVLIPINIKG